MNATQRALLQQIAEGNYLPQLHAPVTVLAWLFRNGLIAYSGIQVSVTRAGMTALAGDHDAR
jgi:hypothetical protein